MSPAEQVQLQRQAASLLSCILSSLIPIFAWWEDISLSKEHAERAEATLYLEFIPGWRYAYICMPLCCCIFQSETTQASFVPGFYSQSAVCLRRSGRDAFVSAFSPGKWDWHNIHFHLRLNLGVNCNSVLKTKNILPRKLKASKCLPWS